MAGTVKHNDLTPNFGLTEWVAEHNFAGGAHGDVLMRDTGASDGATFRSKPALDVRDYGAVGNGSTDDTTAIQAAITAAAVSGGTVFFPPLTFRCNGQLLLPNDGAGIPTQKPIRLLGAGCHCAGRSMEPSGGTILDLRYAGADAKVKTRGIGNLEIAGITFMDGGTSSNAFLFTTNTSLHVHDVAFCGNVAKSLATCDQDAIVLGGTTTTIDGTDTAPFQGYGTVIERCYFQRIRRGVYGRMYCNSVVIRDNTWWATCGSDNTAAAIEFVGSCNGNYVAGNLIEVVGYVYGIRATDSANNYFANSFWDPGSTISYYLFGNGAVYNFVLDVYRADTLPLVGETGTAIGTNSWITAHAHEISTWTQPWTINHNLTAGGQTTFNPVSATDHVLIKPSASRAEGATVFSIKRSAAEGTNPSTDVLKVLQNGFITVGGTNAGEINFQDGAGVAIASFASGLKQWLLAGAGGNMEINSGTGGSYIRFTAFGLKLRDQASANEVVIKSGLNTPEGNFAAPVGSLFLRSNGGAGTTLYVKESGTGTTGWVGK
jgi:hypothetical protein